MATVLEVTEPVELGIVGDRLQFTLVSGDRHQTYSISFHKAANATHCAQRMLERADGCAASVVVPFCGCDGH